MKPETIKRTRKHFASLHIACAREAKGGKTWINPSYGLERYISEEVKRAKQTMRGGSDHTLTFLQYAHFLETGESVAILGGGAKA